LASSARRIFSPWDSVAACASGGGQGLGGQRGGFRDQVELLLAAAVFGLGAEVGGHPFGVGRAVGDDHDLARSGQEVDADQAEDLALGFRHVGVPGAEDLVDRRDRAGAERQGGDGLRAADGVDLAHAAQVEGGEDVGVDLAVRTGRGAGADFGDAGHLGRQRGHQHGRDEGDLAAGDVEAATADGVVPFADRRAVGVLGGPAFRQGAGVERRDALGGLGEGFALFGRESVRGLPQFLEGDAQLPDRETGPVEARGILQHWRRHRAPSRRR